MATPRSHRPGFFHFFKVVFDQDVSGYTTVCQTVFFKRYFRLGHQWPYHGLTDRVSGMVTDVLGQKSDTKKTVCETVVWPLTLKKPGPGDWGMVTTRLGQEPDAGIHHPSKLSLIDKRRTAALKLLPSGSLQIRWRGTEEEEFSFFSWSCHQTYANVKKKTHN